MYIAELDRPWLGSPFLMQGFRLEDLEQLRTLQSLCRHVLVDTRRSDQASVSLLLEKLPGQPAEAPPPARERIDRAAASLLEDEAKPASDASARRQSFWADMLSIGRETWAGSDDTGAADGPSMGALDEASAKGGSQRRRANRPVPPPVAAEAGAHPHGTGVRANYVNAAEGKSQKTRQRLVRPPRARAIDPAHEVGDSANLRGAPLLIATEKGYTRTADHQKADEADAHLHGVYDRLIKDLQEGRDTELGDVMPVIAEMAANLAHNSDALVWVSQMRREDDYTYKHARDCIVQLMRFAIYMGYGPETQQTLGLIGLFLDMGKLRVREALRRKTGVLTEAETEEMRTHVLHSIDILNTINGVSDKVKEAVAQHHERPDGYGHPYRLSGAEIDKLASMSSIVDAYTAMTSDRPYAKALSPYMALLAINEGRAGQFHDALTEQFMQCVGIFPVGTVVEMNSGDIGVVVNQNRAARLKPTVMLLIDPNALRYAYPLMIDMTKDELTLDPASGKQVPYRIRRDLPREQLGIDLDELYL